MFWEEPFRVFFPERLLRQLRYHGYPIFKNFPTRTPMTIAAPPRSAISMLCFRTLTFTMFALTMPTTNNAAMEKMMESHNASVVPKRR